MSVSLSAAEKEDGGRRWTNVRCFCNMETSDLDHGQDTRDNQGRRNEVLFNFRRQVRRTGEQDRRRNDTRQHGERMLQAEQDGEQDGELFIEAEKGSGLGGSPSKGQARCEEEGIVVVANEAVAGEKGVLEGLQAVGKGSLVVAVVRDDLGGSLVFVHYGRRMGWIFEGLESGRSCLEQNCILCRLYPRYLVWCWLERIDIGCW